MAALPFTSLAAPESGTGWEEADGKFYWYEDGVLQGYKPEDASYRGKEIYDEASDAWYWLDNDNGGAKAVSKDVYQESEAGQWGDVLSDGIRYGKWVRYDENGHMIKGWSTTENGTYYFDPVYGTMGKGTVTIDGVTYKFDSATGICEGKTENGDDGNTDDGKPDDGKTDDGDTEEEKVRNIEWSISDDGLLTVTGECGNDGILWDGQDNRYEDPYGMDWVHEYMTPPWYAEREKITSAYVNVKGIKSLAYLFYDCVNLKTVDLGDLDTSGVTNMRFMFSGCGSLTSLNLSSFNTSSVADMYAMFTGCESLTSLDLSSFNTSSVTNMGSYCSTGPHDLGDDSGMFQGCKSLTSLDLSSFDMSNVSHMDSMFQDCRNLESIYVGSGWGERNYSSINNMFDGAGVSEVTYVP